MDDLNLIKTENRKLKEEILKELFNFRKELDEKSRIITEFKTIISEKDIKIADSAAEFNSCKESVQNLEASLNREQLKKVELITEIEELERIKESMIIDLNGKQDELLLVNKELLEFRKNYQKLTDEREDFKNKFLADIKNREDAIILREKRLEEQENFLKNRILELKGINGELLNQLNGLKVELEVFRKKYSEIMKKFQLKALFKIVYKTKRYFFQYPGLFQIYLRHLVFNPQRKFYK